MAKEITTIADFNEVIKSDGLVIVDFWAPWCMPCKMFGKVLEKFVEDAEYSDVTFVKVNVDDAEDLAGDQGIRSLPTIRAYKNGEKVAETMGAMDKEGFKSFIQDNK